ncbi:MAG: conjugal transfer protein TraX [Lachnospiraceae bacterium]|nr:conjugal transfer protein TraX [Lachnospiraceae bacterium]
MKLSLNRNQIKYIAIIAMVIDHIAWHWVPTTTLLGQVMHFIGRLTGPLMAIMIADGYQYTRDLKKYALRLAIFAVLSWPAYSLNAYGTWPLFGIDTFGVIYTLFLGLMAICIWDRTKLPKAAKVTLVVLLCILSLFGDWPIFDVLWPLFLFIYRDDKKAKWTSFAIIVAVECGILIFFDALSGNPFANIFQLGAFMVIPLYLYVYNGESGSKHPFHKWFFYAFYPAHLLVLYFLYWKM